MPISPPFRLDGDDTSVPVHAASLAVKDVGRDQRMVSTVLESIARGNAGFTVKPAIESVSEGCASGGATLGVNSPAKPRADGVASTSVSILGGTRGVEGVEEVEKGSVGGRLSGGDEQGQNIGFGVGVAATGRESAAVNRYRTARIIDSDIMATMVAEIRPVARAAGHGGGNDAPACTEDGQEVLVPEAERGSTLDAQDGDGDVAGYVVKALKEAGEKGMTVPQLRRSVCGILRGIGAGGNDRERVASMSRALRNEAVACVCGAEDVM